MSGWFPLAAGATERLVPAGDLTMKIVEAGSGSPVLLIHGLGWDHSLWNPTIERFAPRYRMIAADTRGHGGTDKPSGPYDMAMFAHDYAALIRALGLKRVCVVGLSQGGMVAQKLAVLEPELVSSLVLVSTSCKSAPSLRENMEARIQAMDKIGAEAAAKIAAESIFSPGWRAENPDELLRFYAWRSAMPVVPLNAATRALYDFDLSKDLPRISAPTLVVAGAEDVLTRPAGMEEIASLIPGAKYKLVPGAGHMIPVEQPTVITELLSEFLAQHAH